MAFRDDHDALRARAEAAEARLAERDARFDAMEGRLEKVEAELATLREERPRERPAESAPPSAHPPSLRTWGPGIAGGVIAALIAITAAIGATMGPPRSPAPPAPTTWTPPPPPSPPPPPNTAVRPPPPTPVPEPLAEPPLTRARWTATVTATSGTATSGTATSGTATSGSGTSGSGSPEVGASCSIEGDPSNLRFAGLRDARVDLRIVCGEDTLYDWQSSADGVTSRDCTLYEEPAGESFVHWLRCHDRGVREGRPELSLDTLEGTARVFRSDGSLDVELRVEPRSEPRTGRGAYHRPAPPPIGATLERSAVVREVDGYGAGNPGPRVGQRCTMRISPPDGRHSPRSANCRVRLRCGRTTLYGAGRSGWTLCTVDAERAPLRARDTQGTGEDGDPTLSFDLEAGEIQVGDIDGERSTRTVLAIEAE